MARHKLKKYQLPSNKNEKSLSKLRLFSYPIIGVILWQMHVDAILRHLKAQMIAARKIPVVVDLHLF